MIVKRPATWIWRYDNCKERLLNLSDRCKSNAITRLVVWIYGSRTKEILDVMQEANR